MRHRWVAFGPYLHEVTEAELEAETLADAEDDDLTVQVATRKQRLVAHQLPHHQPSATDVLILA